ncbi:hypothetical protein N1F89_00010 [Aquibium sp. A9E412]|uniref:hypothetical protein n=1 Tax=Aquibium sp. A9E412 TaxID=2976767 RepID=UPI0025AF9361|nr:hypothetical protein [Aquibium sp. A9E412]MDN2564596.1 hypothetical protein [Aquibium sp. A9E412]
MANEPLHIYVAGEADPQYEPILDARARDDTALNGEDDEVCRLMQTLTFSADPATDLRDLLARAE